jgi:hypothetical protein
MGHCIQTIIARSAVADAVCDLYPQLLRVDVPQGFAVIPVEAEFIDLVCEARPQQSSNDFKLLTDSFCEFLRELSRFGALAYLETEYFGGVGGQGAVVYCSREILMEPTWQKSGIINKALRKIGVRRSLFGDRFSAIGLRQYRSNDALKEATIHQISSG